MKTPPLSRNTGVPSRCSRCSAAATMVEARIQPTRSPREPTSFCASRTHPSRMRALLGKRSLSGRAANGSPGMADLHLPHQLGFRRSRDRAAGAAGLEGLTDEMHLGGAGVEHLADRRRCGHAPDALPPTEVVRSQIFLVNDDAFT